jgi:hypothetical protein
LLIPVDTREPCKERPGLTHRNVNPNPWPVRFWGGLDGTQYQTTQALGVLEKSNTLQVPHVILMSIGWHSPSYITYIQVYTHPSPQCREPTRISAPPTTCPQRLSSLPPWLARELEPNRNLLPDYSPSIHPSCCAGGCWFTLAHQ